MNFNLSESSSKLVDRVRIFAESEISPHAKRIDETGEIPEDLLKKLATEGLFGLPFPTEFGGGGHEFAGFVRAVEEVAAADSSVAVTLLAHTLCANHIYSFGTSEQKQKFLPPLLKGEVTGAWALTEPSAGCDAGSVKTTAVEKDRRWIINGHKIFITNGARASIFIIAAKTDREKLGAKGISVFIAKRSDGGIELIRKLRKLGLRGSDTAELSLNNLSVPLENLVGKREEGFSQVMQVLDSGRVAIAAMAVGIGRAAFEASVTYSKERVQFGKPVSGFQANQIKIADMATELEAARLLYLKAATLKDEGNGFSREASMAKLFASESAVKCTERALQIHGGYGYIDDYPVERYLRDARILTIGEGTSEIQRVVIAKDVLS